MAVIWPSASGAVTNSGGKTPYIVGGPHGGFQVNSSNATAVVGAASAMINLGSNGLNQTGFDVEIVGVSSPVLANSASSDYRDGTTGVWTDVLMPVRDPYGGAPVPANIKSQI